MWFNQNHQYYLRKFSLTFLGVAFVFGLILLTTGCGGAAATNTSGGGGGGMLFGAPATTPLQVWVGAEPTDRILCMQLQVSSIQLKKSADANATNYLLGANGLELTRLAATYTPVAVADVIPDTFDQLEMDVSGARVTYLDANGVVQEKDVTANQSSLLALSPAVTVGEIPTMLSINVDIEQTVQVDPVNNVVTLNAPVISATQSDIPSAVGPAPSAVKTGPKAMSAAASNQGQIERVVGQVMAASSDQFSLQVGQSNSGLTLHTDANTAIENATPDTLNGMLVSVEGRALADGTLYASEVEAMLADTGAEVEGTLGGLNKSGLMDLVAEDGIGAGMTSDLVGAKISVVLDSASYGINLGNEDMGGLPVLFDESHIAAGQRIEVESDQGLQADWAGNAAQIQPFMVELLRQSVKGTVQNYQAGTGGTAEFDLVLSKGSYLGVVNVGTDTVHVYQRSTTQASGGIQNGQNVTVRGFLFCTDSTDSIPPGTTLHFAMVASSISGND